MVDRRWVLPALRYAAGTNAARSPKRRWWRSFPQHIGLAALALMFVVVVMAGCGRKAGEVRINPKDGAEMVWVPAGEFTMGSSDKEVEQVLESASRAGFSKKLLPALRQLLAAEKPRHRVYLDGYWMYKHEITVAQYRKFCDVTSSAKPEKPEWGWKDDYPMVNVTWDDAAAYAKWAGARLPTEAEWEKAARGTDGRVYPWGDEFDSSKCVNSVWKARQCPERVGSCPGGASPYGAMDMAGNVWEWCADWYQEDYYSRPPQGGWRNPPGPTSGGCRVLRGGGWSGYGYAGDNDGYRCAFRYRGNPSYGGWYYGGGFRLAR